MSVSKPCMDNNRLIVVSETRDDFNLALALAFRHHGKAVGWSLWEPKRTEHDKDRPEDLLGVCARELLVLHWCKPSDDRNVNKLPVEMGVDLASSFAWEWLQTQKYENEPDHDGDNSEGFIVFNEAWGHVNGAYSAICAIGTAWAMRGK